MPSMSAIVGRFTKDTILYWEKKGIDGFGKPSYNDPIAVRVLWEDKQQEIITKEGRMVRSKGYLLSSTPLKEAGLVFIGTIRPSRNEASIRSEWQKTSSYPEPPTVADGAREIIMTKTTPTIQQLPGYAYEIYL